jgi:3',5'-cyclic AMP phosphodiesterase CpdA
LTVYRLAHLSDLHLPADWTPTSLAELFSKRTTSRIAWRRKKHRHSPKVLEALAADIAAWAPDHVALTGDLTNFSTADEFSRARAWLEGLGEASRVTVSPGNHDALVGAGLEARFAALRPWFGDAGEDFPFVRRRGPIAIVNLRSAEPTPLHLATGKLGEAQLERLDGVLEDLGHEGLVRVLLLHHPVVDGTVSKRKALTDAAALRDVAKRRGAELILHGHAHKPAFGAIPGPMGPIPVLGAASASSTRGGDEPAWWQAIEIEADGGRPQLRVVVRGYAPLRDAMDEVGRYVLTGPSAGIAA